MRMIDDKTAYIREIQQFLTVALDNSGITFINGNLDGATRCAIVRFKTENGLSPDTEIDLETYELIYADYLRKCDGHIELNEGARSDGVLLLNTMLKTVLKSYTDPPTLYVRDYYSAGTAEAVLFLKVIYGMQPSRDADSEFIKRIKAEYSLIGKTLENGR